MIKMFRIKHAEQSKLKHGNLCPAPSSVVAENGNRIGNKFVCLKQNLNKFATRLLFLWSHCVAWVYEMLLFKDRRTTRVENRIQLQASSFLHCVVCSAKIPPGSSPLDVVINRRSSVLHIWSGRPRTAKKQLSQVEIWILWVEQKSS